MHGADRDHDTEPTSRSAQHRRGRPRRAQGMATNSVTTSRLPLITLSSGQYENTDESIAKPANIAKPTAGAPASGRNGAARRNRGQHDRSRHGADLDHGLDAAVRAQRIAVHELDRGDDIGAQAPAPPRRPVRSTDQPHPTPMPARPPVTARHSTSGGSGCTVSRGQMLDQARTANNHAADLHGEVPAQRRAYAAVAASGKPNATRNAQAGRLHHEQGARVAERRRSPRWPG